MSDNTTLVERLHQIAEHNWRISLLAHTLDTAAEALARIAELEAELSTEQTASRQAMLTATERFVSAEVRTAELEAERDQALKIERLALVQVKETTAVLEQIVAERDRLKAALRPFAETAELTNDLPDGYALDEIMLSLSVGDLRRARAALSGEGVTT